MERRIFRIFFLSQEIAFISWRR